VPARGAARRSSGGARYEHPTLLGEAAGRHDEAAWSCHSIELIQNDQRRSADTHLLKLYLPAFEGIDVYLKDESTHPTGSLKHRLARSLFLYGICNGRIRHDTPIVEASSGSTAISEAYFARMLGLRFHAVMSASTSQEKVQEIERQGGECHLVADGKGIYAAAEELASKLGGVYMDQFTYAERARLARQQQHRRIDLRADEPRRASSAHLDRHECRHGRHDRHDRPLHPLQAAGHAPLRRGCRVFGVLRGLRHPQHGGDLRSRLTHRGHRPAARRAVVHPQGH
jgi:hypothetical protein